MIKQHKKAPVIAAMALTALLSQAAWANEETTLLAPVFESNELSAAFEQSAEPMQMLALSEQEMNETEGARSPWGAVANVWRNTNFDGYNPNTGRIAQIRYNGPPVFRLDYAPNPSPSMLHMHFFNESAHRPWYAPWQKF